MTKIDIVNTYVLNPTNEQKVLLSKAFEAYKWVFNYFLDTHVKSDPTHKSKLFPAAMYSRLLTQLRKDVELLNSTSSHIQQAALNDLSHKFEDIYFKKRERILPVIHNSEMSIEVQGSSLSYGDKWVRFPKVGRIRHKHNMNPNLEVRKLMFRQPSCNTFAVDLICRMSVQENAVEKDFTKEVFEYTLQSDLKL